jgi:excisionase family DNA binding protein
MSGGRLYTYGATAEELDCSVSTVRRRVRTGDLPVFADGGLRRIREDDLRRYIADHVRRRSMRPPTALAGPGRTLPRGARLWD